MRSETFGRTLRALRQQRRLSLRKLQILVRYDFTYLGQVERGEKPGSLELARTCDQVLEAGGTLLDAYGQEERCRAPNEEADDVRRRTALKLFASTPLLGTGVAGLEALDGSLESAQLGRTTAALRELYHGAGDPRGLLSLCVDQLDAATQALKDAKNAAGRRRILHVCSELATLAGRISYFDLKHTTDARGYFGRAYEAATQADDGALAAAALGHLAFVPAREGNLAAASDYLAGAARHADQAGVFAVRSWTRAIEAELMIADGPGRSLRALEQADSLLRAAPFEPTPDWFNYYCPDRLAGFQGQVQLLLGRTDEARRSLTTALTGLPAVAVKQRAVILFDLATTHVAGASPDLDQACRLGKQAIDQLAVAGYATAAERLGGFRQLLQPWQHDKAVHDLDDRLAELIR